VRTEEEETAASDARRHRRVESVAWLPAAAVALVVAAVLYYLSQSGPLTALVGCLGLAGAATSWLIKPVRAWLTSGLVKVFRFISEQT
jgi:uncharacterized membrane protein